MRRALKPIVPRSAFPRGGRANTGGSHTAGSAPQAAPVPGAQANRSAAAQPFNSPDPSGMPPAQFRLKTNRSLLMYILLTLVTCGFYSWYFIYALARDVNAACSGDGRSTAGLIKLLLLGFITCGIYSWIWY